MGPYMIGEMLGGLVAVALISRLLLYLLRKWNSPPLRAVVANGLALTFATVVGGYGFATEGSEPAFWQAFQLYLFPQLVCAAYDLGRAQTPT